MTETKPLSGYVLFLVALALSLATFMIVLDYSIANISIPYISGDLGVSTDQGTYVITSFAVGNAISLPITGWLTKRIGAVKLICISLGLFTFFSWLCGLSFTYPMLISCRFLQGLSSGSLIPLSQTLMVMSYPAVKKNTAIMIWSTIVVAAPVLGPMLGGWISFDYTWPWIFYINVPVGILSLIILWIFLRGRETPLQREPADWLGLILLALFVSCLQIVLDKGEQYDWFRSNIMRAFGITSFVSFTFLIVWSLTHPRPLIELKLFKVRSYAMSVLFIGVAYAIYFGTVVLIPLWLQTQMNYNSIWAGIAVAPIGIAPLLLSKFTGLTVKRHGPLIPLAISFAFFALSCFCTAYLDTDVDIQFVSFTRFLLGLGLLFFITPLFILSIQDVSTEKLASATGIFHFVRALSGGVGTSIFTTLWVRRSAYHHATVGENLTPYSPETNSALQQLSALGLDAQQSLEALNISLDQQASVLAINDCFYLMGWIFILLIFFVPIARAKKQIAQAVALSAIE